MSVLTNKLDQLATRLEPDDADWVLAAAAELRDGDRRFNEQAAAAEQIHSRYDGLRNAVDRAPHDELCDLNVYASRGSGIACDCWKADALGQS